EMAQFESEKSRHEHLAALAARRPFEDLLLAQRRQDGKTVYARISGRPVFDEAGRFKGYRGVGRDVIAQIETERALRESEARFRDLTELSSDWYWEQDADFRFTLMSGGEPGKTGRNLEETLGKTRWELEGIAISEEEWAAHRSVLEAHQPFRDFTYKRLRPDGSIIYVSVSGRPFFDAEGNFR